MEQNLVELAPGLPTLLAELFAAQEKRLTTPTSQPVIVVLPPVTLTDEYCQEIDMAMLRYKQNDGPAKDNQDRAVKLEQQWSEAARLGGMLS